MTNNELDDEIDELAIKIEKKIIENRKRIEALPEFAPRSKRSKKLRKQVTNDR